MDVMTVQSRYEEAVFTRAFALPQGVCRVVGLPRNDELAKADQGRKRECQRKLGIAAGKKVILYAPTFREDQQDQNRQCIFAAPIDWSTWQQQLGGAYVVLLRVHYEAIQAMQISRYPDFIVDVSGYESLNELMIASDLLISDYSSMFFDYAILMQPMICFAYDYEQYQAARGLYFDIRSWLPGGAVSQAEIITLIRALESRESYEEAVEMTGRFRDKFVESCGNSTQKVVEMIAAGMKR